MTVYPKGRHGNHYRESVENALNRETLCDFGQVTYLKGS